MENVEIKTKELETDLKKNLEALHHKDWKVRKAARILIENAGHEATDHLIRVLQEGNLDARWGAAKALIAIKDPTAAEALVEAFHDESFEIQWLAAEALIALGEKCVPAILKALIQNPESQLLRKGAHHVLSDLERHQLINHDVEKVLDDLRMIGPWEHVVLVAEHALASYEEEVPENV